MYEYKCRIVKVVDGDTVDVDIDLGFGVWLHDERIRLAGIDAPESRTRDLVEKQFGLLAKAYVEAQLPVGSTQKLVTSRYDETKGKFGRVLGDFNMNGYLLTQRMIAERLAVPYDGGNKDAMEALHEANREWLIKNHKITLEE